MVSEKGEDLKAKYRENAISEHSKKLRYMSFKHPIICTSDLILRKDQSNLCYPGRLLDSFSRLAGD